MKHLILSVLSSLLTTPLVTAQPPNFLIIFADDIGYEAIGAYGGLDYETPEVDRMAANGVRFNRAYTSPVCTPSRVSLHTSLYTSDHGHSSVLRVHLGTRDYVDFDAMPTFAQLLRDSGYATSTTGKWQLATLSEHPEHIRNAGFDSWCVWQIWTGTEKTERYWDPYLNRDGIILDNVSDRFGPDVLRDYVIEQMTTAAQAGQPFFILHNELLPHTPIVQTPDDVLAGRSASLAGMINYMDKLVGELLDAVEDLGIRENTYVFFIGDNGTESRTPRQTVDGPVTGGKRNLSEAGTRVPFVVWGPQNLVQGAVIQDLVDITDVFPTICELAGIPIPENLFIRGQSIAPQMVGRVGLPRTYTHQGIDNYESIFDGNWRLLSNGQLRDATNLPNEPFVAIDTPERKEAAERLQAIFEKLRQRPEGMSIGDSPDDRN